MSADFGLTTSLQSLRNKPGFGRFVAAAGIYTVFAIYLYRPHFQSFSTLRYLVVANASLAALGCYVLSRRWVASFAGSFFAGLIYGFGPFMLGLARFHLTAGFLTAAIPWLFCPAAFGPKGRFRWLRVPLSVLPFLGVVLFFQMAAHYRLFVVPTQSKLHLADLAGLLAPLVVAGHSMTPIGFYHVPIAALVMGFSMLIAARRLGILIIFFLGVTLALCAPVFNISPTIWLAFPTLCCAILIGEGMQGIISAGWADRKWVLTIAVIMSVLLVVTLLLATNYYRVFAGLGTKYANLFVEAAKMYMLGAIAVGIIFFMARAKLRILPLRWAILSSAMSVDIFFGARFMVDKIL